MKARKAGATIVVVNPIKTPTAAHADQHIQIRPGSDAALALAMMHVIVRDDLHDKEFIEAHTLGFDQLAVTVKEYPPQRAAEITGIDANVIEKLAHAYATSRPAGIRFLVGVERYSNGHVAVRAVSCLPGLINGWRERGGGLSHFMLNIFFDAFDYGVMLPSRDAPPRGRSANLAQLGKLLTDPEMDPPIKWMMVYNANPVVTAANQNRTIEGMKREDLFSVGMNNFSQTRHSMRILCCPRRPNLSIMN